MPTDHQVTGEGVWFGSRDGAKIYADAYDKDPVESDGGWLAKNRATQFGPMPTKDGTGTERGAAGRVERR
jgi:hypothetical protein